MLDRPQHRQRPAVKVISSGCAPHKLGRTGCSLSALLFLENLAKLVHSQRPFELRLLLLFHGNLSFHVLEFGLVDLVVLKMSHNEMQKNVPLRALVAEEAVHTLASRIQMLCALGVFGSQLFDMARIAARAVLVCYLV